jgi:hypothetical protein
MRRLFLFSALLLALNLLSNLAPAQIGSTTSVIASPAATTVGSSVAFTARSSQTKPLSVRATPLPSPAGRSPYWTEVHC